MAKIIQETGEEEDYHDRVYDAMGHKAREAICLVQDQQDDH
jgi:hypothetical protein